MTATASVEAVGKFGVRQPTSDTRTAINRAGRGVGRPVPDGIWKPVPMRRDDDRRDAQGSIYEERYGFPPKMLATIAGCIAFVVVALVVDLSTATRALTIGLFGGGGALLTFLGLSRRVALRADGTGITLGGSPLRYDATVLKVPWSEVDAVVLWRQEIYTNRAYVSMDYLGVQRRTGSSSAESGSRRAASGVPPVDDGIDAGLVADSRAITGYRLDEDRLAAALRYHAPSVHLVDRRRVPGSCSRRGPSPWRAWTVRRRPA